MLKTRNSQLTTLTGQSTLEYAVMIAVVVGALLAMRIYMKRGIEGKLRESTDQVGEQFSAGDTVVTSTTGRTSTTVQEVSAGLTTSYTGSSSKGAKEVRTESGSETVAAW